VSGLVAEKIGGFADEGLETIGVGGCGGLVDVGVELAEMSGEAFAENGVVVEHENSATRGKGGLEEHTWGGAVGL